eukprot:3492531-Rhodomonas_salina.2
MTLPTQYKVPGTDAAYGATHPRMVLHTRYRLSGTDAAYGATHPVFVPQQGGALGGGQVTPAISYALSLRTAISYARFLLSPYARSATSLRDARYLPTRLLLSPTRDFCYSPTRVSLATYASATRCGGTELAYGATRIVSDMADSGTFGEGCIVGVGLLWQTGQ